MHNLADVILLRLDSAVNWQQNLHHISHHTLSVSLHYLVNLRCSNFAIFPISMVVTADVSIVQIEVNCLPDRHT